MATRAGAHTTAIHSAHDSLISHPDAVDKLIVQAARSIQLSPARARRGVGAATARTPDPAGTQDRTDNDPGARPCPTFSTSPYSPRRPRPLAGHRSSIETRMSITGAIWHLKGQPDVLNNIRMRVDTHAESGDHLPRPGQVHHLRSAAHRGRRRRRHCADVRENPEEAFQGHGVDTPWDDVHVAYFSGEALWTYLNTPFIYTRDDFVSEEVDPIEVNGERCRRLKVTFPDTVKSHTREQFSSFGPDGLLRRHDYTVDILGGATGLNYATDYRNVDGLIIPTTRRIYGYDGDYQLIPEPLLVGIDITQIALIPRAM